MSVLDFIVSLCDEVNIITVLQIGVPTVV